MTQQRMQNFSPHIFLVKGKGYQPPFGAGAGHVHFELDTYTSASLEWVLCKEWEILQIRPIKDYLDVEAKISWACNIP